MEILCLLFLFCGVLSSTMGSEVKPMDDPDLVETLINLKQWKEEIERRVSSVEKKSLEHKDQLLEKIEEVEVKSKNRADDLSLKLQEVRSIEEEFRSALERERLKTHSLQVQMTELISKLHSVDLVKKDVTSLTDNLRQHLDERLTFGIETIQSNLTENMRVFENSSLTFSKDISKLEENLKDLRKSSKADLETLQSSLSPRFETLEERSSLCDEVPEMKETLTNHSSQLSRLNELLWDVENTCTGEPPSTPNGKPLKFDRKHNSHVQYECDPDFVPTGNSTVICLYGRWEGQPPNCTCELGLYGAECEQTCHCANGPASCDRKTGACSGGCSPGWIGQSCQIPDACAGEPPSIRNGYPLRFDRKNSSIVQYKCHLDFVMTGNSTVICKSGSWEGEPPICSVFDTTFILVASFSDEEITCYNDRHVEKIAFSRVVDTAAGPGLPTGASTRREEGVVLDLDAFDYEVKSGAYECGFQLNDRSVGIVATYNYYSFIEFKHLSKVASIGDTVELDVSIFDFVNRSMLRWTRNGVPLPSWDGQTKVEITGVRPDDAGIYRCYREGDTRLYERFFRMIVRKCGKNRYGVSCERECPTCYNGGICHDLLGLCVCPLGFTGKDCEIVCGENHFSADCAHSCTGSGCSEKFFCKPDPFGCACFPGFTGDTCDRQCGPGKYGADCRQTCHCADGPEYCNRFTGACSRGCSPGWSGQSCQIPGNLPTSITIKGFFDKSFILVADYSYQKEKITCYSERHVQKIAFSRVVHNQSGPGLPTNASTRQEEGAVLQLNEVRSRVRTGAYECEFQLNNRSVGIVAPYNSYGYVQFHYLSQVANIGDTVELEVFISDSVNRSMLRWTRNGVPVPSWDGQTKVEIKGVRPDDAGIYRCYREGKRKTFQRLFRLIVRKCGKNRYGVSCEWECPACYNGGICHDLLGLCLCPAGFTGKKCEFACGENHFGADCSAKLCTGYDCKYRFFCKPDPFGCACFPGFKGFMCSEPCDPGQYGADCKQVCHCADRRRSCNRFTGACSGRCSRGWSGQSCMIPDTCAGEPPSTPNGKPLKFERKHASVVQYDCDRDFVPTGNSTVHCVSGRWEGQPPNCSFFDTTFFLVAHYWFRQGKITCYSDRHIEKIAFSRVVDTGTGPGLPTNASTRREEGVVLQLNSVDHEVRTGAYECGIQLNDRSVEIVAPFNNDYGYVQFHYLSEVANIGDTVELEVVTYDLVDQSRLRWRRNGVPVPSWDGQTKVEITGVRPDDAGIYECYQEGERNTRQSLFRLIVRKCGMNRYGVSCERECPTCYNGGICHDILGLCVCPAGFTGKNCEFVCGENHFGADCAHSCTGSGCSGKFFCKPDPFGCACFPGFRGVECREQCQFGQYGADCRQICHCAKGRRSCNRFTGTCSGGCSPGWSGQSCMIPV